MSRNHSFWLCKQIFIHWTQWHTQTHVISLPEPHQPRVNPSPPSPPSAPSPRTALKTCRSMWHIVWLHFSIISETDIYYEWTSNFHKVRLSYKLAIRCKTIHPPAYNDSDHWILQLQRTLNMKHTTISLSIGQNIHSEFRSITHNCIIWNW